MIYEFDNYKKFLNDLIVKMPKRGRGQARRLSEHLRIQPVVVSQVLSGERHFTPEQGLEIGSFFGLDDTQTDYLVSLISKARAGTKNLRDHYDKKLSALRSESLKIKNAVVEHRVLSDPDKGIFYSNWFYSAVSLLTSIEGMDNIDAISRQVGLSRSKVGEILEFLVTRGLVNEKNGRYEMGVSSTFIDNTSPFINGHRRNWRLKAIEKFSEPRPHNLFYASPCSLSEKDLAAVRVQLTKFIAEFSKTVADSPAEKVACLNIDWFEV